MHRFFCPQNNFDSETIIISDSSEVHHIKDVLRLKTGEQIQLFNNEGKEVAATILSIKKNSVSARRDLVLPPQRNDQPLIILACAVPKKAKFEYIIEKCTELGIDEIIPLKTQRTEGTGKLQAMDKKLTRYQTVAINAAKQSARRRVPVIHKLSSFTNALKEINNETIALIPCLSGDRQSLVDVQIDFKKIKRILYFIGPEGDFTPEELKEALSLGCIPVTLGPTVLKVDTAAISVMSFLNILKNKN